MTQLILLGCVPSAKEVAERFVLRIGNPHRGEITAAMTARELLRVAANRLDAIARFHRGMSVGATTWQSIPISVNCQYRT